MIDTSLLSPAQYGVIIVRGLKCRARDGVMLSVDLYRPAIDGNPAPGQFPAIITRSPYDTRSGKGPSGQQANGEFFASHGYIYAVQDSRGRFESEGEFELLNLDGEDGYDVIEWLAGLPYCDGRVGTQGTSLRAWNQNAAALERPPHLRCMWINQGGANGLTSALRHNGAFELRWICWALTNAIMSQEAQADPALQNKLVLEARQMRHWMSSLPWTEGQSPLRHMPKWEKWLLEMYRNAEDGPYWDNRSRNFEKYRDQSANVPTMYAGAWYDSYARASVENFQGFQKLLDNQYLMMSPGIHGGPFFDARVSGQVDMGPNAPYKGNFAETRLHLMLAWYDRWLKGIENGVDQAAPVRYFQMGGDGSRNAAGQLLHGGTWREAGQWPPERSQLTDFFLTPDAGLAAEGPVQNDSFSTLLSDPANPTPTISGNVSSMSENLVPMTRMMRTGNPISLRRLIVLQGAQDQVVDEDVWANGPLGDLALREDVLVFETAPLSEDLIVAGTPEVEIFLSSDAPDTDVFCMVQDVYPASETWPEGYRMNICDSLMRARYRNGFAKGELLREGEVVRLRFPLYPTANTFAAGHRIRLVIAPSNFPRFDVNPQTGEPIGYNTTTRKAVNAIHHSASHPSRLLLPVMS